MKSFDFLHNVVQEHVGGDLAEIVNYSIDLAPYIGQLNQTRKIYRAEKRIKIHSKQLKNIQKLFNSELVSKDYIQERIGPIVLADLIEEHEDAKINYLLTGFENVFLNQNIKESLVLNYFDTLRSLRYEDVRMLLNFASLKSAVFENTDYNSELRGLGLQIYTKLERLYLINSLKTFDYMELGPEASEEALQTTLTPYGKHFVSFVKNDFNIEHYEREISKRPKYSD